ncbi:MAG: DUF3656 domain-containing protein [Lutisporaceae bacterium]
MNNIELLAPAGSIEALKASVESGADAVYLGGTKFNARAFANNLDEKTLREAVEYAHIRGVKIYVTVNILILQNELAEVLEYVHYLYTIDVDAVIVQDIGLAVMIRNLIPDFKVHCSTQMAIHNTDGAGYLAGLGINRVVLARELTLSEVNEISKDTDIEAEVFIHGALCVGYSGQCYMSSLIGGRSGNRGKCAQPCRKKYRLYDETKAEADKGAYLISTKDLNTYTNLYEITKSNIAALKIEGRMKRQEYVAVIVKNYKDAIDCISNGNADCISTQAEYELLIAFNREFTKGYLFGDRNQDIVSTKRPDNRGIYIGKIQSQKGNIAEVILENNYLNDGDGIEVVNTNGKTVGCIVSGIKKDGETVKKAIDGDKIRLFISEKVVSGSIVNKTLDSELFNRAREEYSYTNRKKIVLEGVFTAKLEQNPVLELRDKDGNSVKVVSDEIVQKAEKLAITQEKVQEQLNKTGETPYSFEKLEITIDPGCFLSVKAINNLRRNAIEQLSNTRIKIHGRDLNIDIKQILNRQLQEQSNNNKKSKAGIIAGIKSIENAKAAINGGANEIYILGDYSYNANQMLIEEAARLCKETDSSLYYVLPQITRNHEVRHIEGMLTETFKKWDNIGLVISNLGHLPLANRLKPMEIRGNFSLNIFNSISANHLSSEGLSSLCMSPELNLSQIKELTQKTSLLIEGLVYGYIPAMITEYCPSSTGSECNSCKEQDNKEYGIIDEKEKLFRVINLGNCRNLILNSDVLCVYDNLSSIIESDISKLRLDFYIENNEEVFDIIKAYKQKLENLTSNICPPIINYIKQKSFTKGHYFRGID